jgi:chromosome segregation ATPase
MKIIILLASILIASGIANAEIYQWTDKSGGIHFTDDQEKIPPEYRNKTKEIDLTPAVEENEPQTNQPDSNMDNSAPSYGGHDEKWWRSSFRSIREDIKRIQDGLPAKRDRLRELKRVRKLFHKPADRLDINDLENEIKQDEEQIATLEKKLADLDTEASRNAVPLEWRK